MPSASSVTAGPSPSGPAPSGPVADLAPEGSGRRPAWIEALHALRAAVTTEPGRLRVIGAVLALLVLGFGALAGRQADDRAQAAREVVQGSRPLSADAALLHRSLADADTTAAAGFLAGGAESRADRARYAADLATASRLLVEAAAQHRTEPTTRRMARLNRLLPRYAGLIETARANNRQDLPLGGAYLRYANALMRGELLPEARALYDAETDRLADGRAAARSWPWAATAAGLVALGALLWAQRREARRTNRVLNPGLVAATLAVALTLGWLVAAQTAARTGLGEAASQQARSLRVLTEARITALRARGDENLTLVARGAVLTEDQHDYYEAGFRAGMADLVGPGDVGAAAAGSRLGRALALADDAAGARPVRAAVASVRQWQQRHARARAADERGDYPTALRRVNGTDLPTREAFDRVDAALRTALDHAQDRFRRTADDGRAGLAGLPPCAAALAVLGAAGAVLGIGRGLSEFR